jgi:NAD-dependent deacetylase
MPRLVILTGAGISQESGIPTFRDANGLWEGHNVEDVASPEGFARDPHLVHRFYNLRRARLNDVEPNAGHYALAQLEKNWKGDFLLVTQNVDDLHARAGSRNLRHMHGELRKARCEACLHVTPWEHDLSTHTSCPACHGTQGMRPHIVWFHEVPFHLEEIFHALSRADIFLSVGTSGNVYPAAGFVQHTPRTCRRIEVNVKGTEISRAFEEHRQGKGTEELPKLVQELLHAGRA